MIVNYSDNIVLKGKSSIFLAGPTIRKEQEADLKKESWRKEAISILNELNFDGIVYVPEYEKMKGFVEKDAQFEWEWNALHSSSVIVFWIPRKFPELPAMSTNVEFGFYVSSGKPIIYGRPNDSDKHYYLDKLYEKVLNKTPFNNLKDTLIEAIKELQ
ncbi:MAG: nucleoside 2-deoxyribosyltransferase domain-containing protein [Clostridia bacterium]